MHPPLFIYGDILTYAREKINPFSEFASYFDAESAAFAIFPKTDVFSARPKGKRRKTPSFIRYLLSTDFMI